MAVVELEGRLANNTYLDLGLSGTTEGGGGGVAPPGPAQKCCSAHLGVKRKAKDSEEEAD